MKWLQANEVKVEGEYWVDEPGEKLYIRYIREYSGNMCFSNWEISDRNLYWGPLMPPNSQEFEESVNSSASPVQQLKAEIAKILSNTTKMTQMDGYITVAFDETSYQRLKQLSAD